MKFSHRGIVLLALIAPLTGCLTTSPEEQAKLNETRCVNRGYKPGTPEFMDCVVRIESERGQRMESNRRYELEKPNTSATANRGY